MILWLLTACFVRYEPLEKAVQAERRGDEDAEETWRAVLDQDLLVGEWRTARRRLCALREPRISAELAALDPATVAPGTLGALKAQVLDCPGAGSLVAELTMREQAAAIRDLEQIATTDVPVYEKLVAATDLAPHVLEDHPFRATLDGWRVDWHAQLQDRLARAAGPATRAWVGAILADSGGPEARPLEAVAEDALANHVATLSWRGDPGCASLPTGHADRSGAGAAVRADIAVTGCTTRQSQGLVDVPYTVVEYRWEERSVPYTTSVTTVTTTHNINCWYSIQQSRQVCNHVGTSTNYDTETTTSYRTERVRVGYDVTKYRKETRYTTTATAMLTATVVTPDGRTVLPARTVTGSATGKQPPSAAAAFAQLHRDAAPTVVASVQQGARELRRQALAQVASVADADGLEALLVLHGAGRPLTDTERAGIARLLDLPTTAVASDRRPLGSFAPREVAADPLAYQLPRPESEALRWGFPMLMYSTGFHRVTGGSFVAHEDPARIGATVNLEGNFPLSTGLAANGLAIHLQPVGELAVGWRTNRRHTFQEVPLGASDNEREPRMGQGARAGVGLLVGYRTTAFALLGGVLPQAHYGAIGFYQNAGQHVHLAGRLELRPTARRPVLVNGWFGDLLDPGNTDFGVRASLPVGERIWITAEHSAATGGTRLRGLHERDLLDGGDRALRRTWVGWSVGF
jgi:hypothetical protein